MMMEMSCIFCYRSLPLCQLSCYSATSEQEGCSSCQTVCISKKLSSQAYLTSGYMSKDWPKRSKEGWWDCQFLMRSSSGMLNQMNQFQFKPSSFQSERSVARCFPGSLSSSGIPDYRYYCQSSCKFTQDYEWASQEQHLREYFKTFYEVALFKSLFELRGVWSSLDFIGFKQLRLFELYSLLSPKLQGKGSSFSLLKRSSCFYLEIVYFWATRFSFSEGNTSQSKLLTYFLQSYYS